MKIVCWNVNGLRAIARKGFFDEIMKYDADVYCFQETKCSPDQLEENIRSVVGYHSYFSWPNEKKGYSGVAIYTKEKPKQIFYGMDMRDEFSDDEEGRVVTAVFQNHVLVNCYFPNGGGGPERLEYKLKFYKKMFGNAFKNASRFFGTHFTQMNPNTILRLSPTQSFNYSLKRVEKL